jgi:hypothetical protein
MDLSKPAPQPLPQSFKGHLCTAVLHPDRVEFRRPWVVRLGGNRPSTVVLADVLKVVQVAPTRLMNGHVHLVTAADPGGLRAWADAPVKQVAGNPRAIMFAWGQREAQAAFVAAVEAALQGLRPGL